MHLTNNLRSSQRRSTIVALVLSSLLCALLVFARVVYAGSLTYAFLIWNLLLAWIPFGVSLLLYVYHQQRRGGVLLLLLGTLWLLFYPNAPYIITDFVHLQQRPGVPMWYDLALIASSAWTGLLLGFVSLYLVQKVVRAHIGSAVSWLFVLAVNGVSGFGIYLGRFQRWNSWDVLANPRGLLADVWPRIADPLAHPRTLGVSLTFALFLLVAYLIVSSLLRFEAEATTGRS
jgi:uncharacterized membrane protein